MQDNRPARMRALDNACKYIGVRENPPGSNRGRLIDRWNQDACGMVGVFWCASFVHGMFKEAGVELPGGASVQKIRQAGITAGWIVKRPRRGDLVCFDFTRDDRYGPFGDHIGFVERVLALRWSGGRFTGWIRTVEANTSGQGLTGSQSDGGGVFRRWRWVRGIGADFVRVDDDWGAGGGGKASAA